MTNALQLLAKQKPKAQPDEISFSLEEFGQTNVKALPDVPDIPIDKPQAVEFSMADFEASQSNVQLPTVQIAQQYLVDAGFGKQMVSYALPDGKHIEVERVTRETVERLFRSTKVGGQFTFYVWAGHGESYTYAVRTMISRIRGKLRGRKHIEFKLNTLEIRCVGNFDRVVLGLAPPGPGSRNSQLYANIEQLWLGNGSEK